MVRISLRRFLWMAAFVILVVSSLAFGVLAADVAEDNSSFVASAGEDTKISMLREEDQDDQVIFSPSEDSRSIVPGVIVESVAPVTPSDATGLKAVLLSLFGNYDPIIVEFSYTNTSGYQSFIREVQPDYVWMISAAVFIIVIFCVFRFVGGVFKRG